MGVWRRFVRRQRTGPKSLPDEMSVFETEIVARVAHAGQLRRPAANVEVLGRTFP